MRAAGFFATFCFIILTSCGEKPVVQPGEQPGTTIPVKTILEEEPGFTLVEKRPINILLYEGLPHQTWEGALLETERKTKTVIELHSFHFYAEKLKLKTEDEATLLDILCSDKSFFR